MAEKRIHPARCFDERMAESALVDFKRDDDAEPPEKAGALRAILGCRQGAL